MMHREMPPRLKKGLPPDPVPQAKTSEAVPALPTTELNRKPAGGAWASPPEVNYALAEATPGRPMRMGASSRIISHEARTKIPLEGGPDSQRDEVSIPNRHA